uniref:Uncharacterized protein n=1 Tax=Paramoeba aestuarina TaxID=180227 RepID=A0A7S4KEK5_9EUKA|mmetsp:Transcript_17683/g.27697  ORF Transcript_17683/g.27697 Transcript_17683/m.27697 type:complete len:454 (+) Transcript_17683:62-1423(+)
MSGKGGKGKGTKLPAWAVNWLKAAKEGNTEALSRISKDEKWTVDETDGAGRTALHFAAHEGKLDAVKLLVEELKAGLNIEDGSGSTPLLLAVRQNHFPVVQFLVKSKATANIVTLNGVTPLHYAAENDNQEMMKFLLENGARLPDYLKLKSKDGDMMAIEDKALGSPLHWAAGSNSTTIMEMLLERDVPIDLRDRNGLTPLHMAASAGNSDAVRLLLAKGANHTLYLQGGATALHLAAEFGFSGVVEALLDAGAPILKDNGMDTPWMLAKAQKRDNILDLFRAKRNWSDEEDKDADFSDKSQSRVQELKDAGNKLFYQKKYRPAMAKYKLALELDRTNHVLYSNVSGCYFCLGEYESALQEAEKCIAFEKNWPKGYYRQAMAELRMGQFDECEKSLEAGFKIDENDKNLKEAKVKLAEARKAAEEKEKEQERKKEKEKHKSHKPWTSHFQILT